MATTLLEGIKQFFSPTETVHKHWYAPVAGFQFVTSDFYERIEKELNLRKVPGLSVSRMELSEGGPLSAKREYLRLMRERLVFDICAAPFGTGYFFSFRFIELPLGIQPAEMIIFVIALMVLAFVLGKILGTFTGFIAFLILLLVAVWVLRNAVALGIKDIDATLLRTPVIGPLYEVFFRKETYFREDTRLMYLTTVNEITAALVEEITAAKGIKIVKRFERKSISADLYRETNSLPRSEPGPEQPA